MIAKKIKYCFLIFCLVGSTPTIIAQQLFKKSIKWANAEKTQTQIQKKTIQPQGNVFLNPSTNVPYVVERIALEKASISAVFVAIETEIIPFIPSNINPKSVAAEFDFNYTITTERKKPILKYAITPIRRNATTGQLEKLLEYDLRLTTTAQKSSTTARTYAQNSVLASGNWYKVGVAADGVYKLSAGSLSNLGIDISNTNPKNIKIYGHAGGMLPQLNSTFRYDDLAELSIQVIGEEDNVFNDGDYVQFYGKGADTWTYNSISTLFSRTKHPYCDTTYYYITTDEGLGKRINTQSSTTLTPTNTATAYSFYTFHEQDLFTPINVAIKSGREWFGEDFEFTPSRDFEFTVKNIDPTARVTVQTDVVGRSSSSNKFTVKGNSQPLYDVFFSGVDLNTQSGRYASLGSNSGGFFSNQENIVITIGHTKVGTESNAWLNKITLNARIKPIFNDTQLQFSDPLTSNTGAITQFSLGNTDATTKIWDISTAIAPTQIDYQLSNTTLSFALAHEIVRYFIAFNANSLLTPTLFGKVPNQNLHALTADYDMVIITAPEFMSEAIRLANFKKTNLNINAVIVTPHQIYNEFSAGTRDVTAFRDFFKMFYDRGGANPKLTCALLLGDGSYDNRNIRFPGRNFIPTYQSFESLSHTTSYVSDDYLGFLDDLEGAYAESNTKSEDLDIAIGRLPVQSLEQATSMVDKIIHYGSAASMGDWRNQITLIADDGDNNLHFAQADSNAQVISINNKIFNLDKIYLDAYKQVSTPGGNRYPDVNDAISKKITTGTLLINYTGHGGELGLAHERILTIADIEAMQNYNKLPVFLTATCSFTRWDDPERTSAGELMALSNKGGAIALFSTVRTVFISPNFTLNQSFLTAVFDSSFTEKATTLGEIYRLGKNFVYLDNQEFTTINSRNFSLIGDPSIIFAIPQINASTLTVNTKSINQADTIRALSKVTITGEIKNKNGVKLTDYTGIIYPTVYDKAVKQVTLGNDLSASDNDSSFPDTFLLQKNSLYKGRASVTNGNFSFTFIVPKDINYQAGFGKISYYAQNGLLDASGFSSNIIIGGIDTTAKADNTGPEVRVFLNNEQFVAGGLVSSSPLLGVKLFDENGINTVGNSIGHDITAVLSKEGQPDQVLTLNDFYEAKIDNYAEGEISYPLNKLTTGKYSLKVKAWDVYNNSGEKTIDFTVAENTNLVIDHVLNYPNPFTTRTMFQFEHNQPSGNVLNVQLRVYTITGKLIKTIDKQASTNGNRISDIMWDGKDDFGDKLARGTYIYQLRVRTNNGFYADKFEKLVILN